LLRDLSITKYGFLERGISSDVLERGMTRITCKRWSDVPELTQRLFLEVVAQLGVASAFLRGPAVCCCSTGFAFSFALPHLFPSTVFWA
jgi:hypothetical protein